MGVAHAGGTKARRAAFKARRRFTKPDSSPVTGIETAILIVNGFDRHSKDPFDLDEARGLLGGLSTADGPTP